jgi:hypothetical protein
MDTRGQLLKQLDLEGSGLRAHCLGFQAGQALADQETAALMALADGVARSLGEWRALIGGLELSTPLDLRRAGVLVLESVFDEILSAPQWRLLAAAFALTELAE